MNKKTINLVQWINGNTYDSKNVIELGAGFFHNLSHVHHNVNLKIGIEIYQPYIDNAVYHDCIKIQGNLLNYKELLKDYKLDTVLVSDVLEHFDMNIGYQLIKDLKNDFNKILLMLPVGKFEQDKDVTGYGAHEYQLHRSYWYVDDILKLNFDENILDVNYHKNEYRISNNLDSGCYFGIWNKK